MIIKLTIRKLKLLSTSFFIIIGLLSLIETLWNKPEYYLRDIIILVILGSPLLINKRMYYMVFGVIASIISLIVFIVYATQNTPWQVKDNTFFLYFTGCLLYLFVLLCALTLVYIGTYSKEKDRFQLI